MPNILTNPLIPEAPVRKLQEQMTEPHLDENPLWTRVKGFGAGALEGLRNLSSPAELAGIASLAIPGIGEAEAPAMTAKYVRPTLDLIEGSPWQTVRQVAPSMGDVDALAGGLKATLAKVPNAVRGLKDAFPSAVHDSQSIRDIARPQTQEMMEKMYQEANPVLQRLRQAGQVGGERTVGDLTPSIYK